MDIERIDLIAGHPALDFVNTVEGRGSDALLNYLPDFEKLVRWCERVRLVSSATRKIALRQAKSDPQAAMRVWRGAMRLRECLNRIFRALANAKRPPEQAMADFNKSLKVALRGRQLRPKNTGPLQWTWRQGAHAMDLPVCEIVLASAALMTDAKSRGRIKVCTNGPCDWMFLDRSRNGRRRWCRMAVCGNISKVRRYRRRRQTKA